MIKTYVWSNKETCPFVRICDLIFSICRRISSDTNAKLFFLSMFWWADANNATALWLSKLSISEYNLMKQSVCLCSADKGSSISLSLWGHFLVLTCFLLVFFDLSDNGASISLALLGHFLVLTVSLALLGHFFPDKFVNLEATHHRDGFFHKIWTWKLVGFPFINFCRKRLENAMSHFINLLATTWYPHFIHPFATNFYPLEI